MYAMAAIFDKPEQQDEREEIMTRIKLLREIVGQEIDRIKGADKPSLPRSWKHFEKINSDDTEAEKALKYRHNSLVISKKPYFFRYLYPELNHRFKQFEASYNQVSRDMFGLKFKKLMKKENKTQEEINLIRKYQKYSPLITSNCTMNILCREIESIDFDIKFAKDGNDKKIPTVSMLPTYKEKYSSQFDQSKLDFVRSLYKTYTSRSSIKKINDIMSAVPGVTDLDDTKEIYSTALDTLVSDLQDRLATSTLSDEEFLFYCSYMAPSYSNFNWGFAWEILDDKLIQLIPYGTSYCPVHDAEGTCEYLGSTYSLKDVSKTIETLEEQINLSEKEAYDNTVEQLITIEKETVN